MGMHFNYRLALDLGSTSLGWAIFRLNDEKEPSAIIRAGVRIFSNGRESDGGTSLAVTRRQARAMRRRRDRLLKRKAQMLQALMDCGFFPQDESTRKEIEKLNPYELRAKGIDKALTPAEFARALFHINQRRGFKSNRKTDSKENDASALKNAIKQTHEHIDVTGADGKARTVGEWLYRRMSNTAIKPTERLVRARYRQTSELKEDGKTRIVKSYDLYIDRELIAAEFDALWAKQTSLNPKQFTEELGAKLKDILLYQRKLKPVVPGRCTLIPEEQRAPLALPSQQRFRMYQEVNQLRILRDDLLAEELTLEQRDAVIALLESKSKAGFTEMKKTLKLSGDSQFNFEDPKRQEFKGNSTSAILSKTENFGQDWFSFAEDLQDNIVLQLVQEESEEKLISWLQTITGVNAARAETIANARLPEGYGSLSQKALAQILPALRAEVITYDKAVIAAGFEHHSQISHAQSTGEILPELPYYAEYLQRHVGFGSLDADDIPEKRYGKIANPTVHIGLNQIRKVVNTLMKRYGHPTEVIVEVARELKQSRDQRMEQNKQQAENQKRNIRIKTEIAELIGCPTDNVKHTDVVKWILWEELNPKDVASRCCPYSGKQITPRMLFNGEVEVEHILPFSRTLDDSLNNKTVSTREANRVKGNQTPWEAFGANTVQGYAYEAIQERARLMVIPKRSRFAEDGYEKWLKNDKSFLARALNDTRYLSRIAKEYLSLVCPTGTRVIPGRMTAMLRGKFGLDKILNVDGIKHRTDHRHHAVDACVIGITDQGMMQRFASASASARSQQLERLVEDMPLPWPTYREHVARAIENIWVSHKPDHGYEGAMHNDTAYGLLGSGRVFTHKQVDGERKRKEENLKVLAFANEKSKHSTSAPWYGSKHNKTEKPYKGYKGDSNYCLEIVRNENGKWEGEVISTFEAYQIVRKQGLPRLRNNQLSQSGKSLVMRLMRDDFVKLDVDGKTLVARVCAIRSNGQAALASEKEANVDARVRNKELVYILKVASSLQKANARRVTISPIGELRDAGLKG